VVEQSVVRRQLRNTAPTFEPQSMTSSVELIVRHPIAIVKSLARGYPLGRRDPWKKHGRKHVAESFLSIKRDSMPLQYIKLLRKRTEKERATSDFLQYKG
jgi:hypothetical protein